MGKICTLYKLFQNHYKFRENKREAASLSELNPDGVTFFKCLSFGVQFNYDGLSFFLHNLITLSQISVILELQPL